MSSPRTGAIRGFAEGGDLRRSANNPARFRVFEVYRDTDAYKSHLETAHFKKYKATTQTMVKALKRIVTTPVMLGSK
jgi:quinol monooxygenase YgiN